jgi:hypothetical protein
MMTIVEKLPPGVSMCEHLRDKVSSRPMGKKKFKYIRVMFLGVSYYVPITKAVWKALRLDEHIRNPNGDLEAGGVWGMGDVDNALRDILEAVYGQLRDNILGEIEQSVMRSVHDRIDEVLHKPLLGEIERKAEEAERKKLPQGTCSVATNPCSMGRTPGSVRSGSPTHASGEEDRHGQMQSGRA